MPTPDPSDVYVDDVNISDETILYRFVKRDKVKFEKGTNNPLRAGSNAFVDQDPSKLSRTGSPAVGVSVYSQQAMQREGRTLEDLLHNWGSEYGVMSITAGQARSCGQGVHSDPKPDAPEHAIIFCNQGPHKTNKQSKDLAKLTKVVVDPWSH